MGRDESFVFPQKRLEMKYFIEGGGKIRLHLESSLIATGERIRRPRGRAEHREEAIITVV